eukprot:scaffold35342_cov112-Isochrysis_galbana.AAC.6
MAINQNAGRHLQSSMLACVWAEFYRGASRWHGRLRSEKSTRHSWRAPENAIRNHFFLAARVPPTSPHGFPRPRLAQNAHAELVAHRHCCGCVALQFCRLQKRRANERIFHMYIKSTSSQHTSFLIERGGPPPPATLCPHAWVKGARRRFVARARGLTTSGRLSGLPAYPTDY